MCALRRKENCLKLKNVEKFEKIVMDKHFDPLALHMESQILRHIRLLHRQCLTPSHSQPDYNARLFKIDIHN